MLKPLNNEQLKVAVGDILQNIEDDRDGRLKGWDGAEYDAMSEIIELIEDQKQVYLEYELNRIKESVESQDD